MKRVKDGFRHDDTVLVASETSPKPHVVTEYKNGKFGCDDMCPAFNHSGLCGLLQWHKKNAMQTKEAKNVHLRP